MSTTEDLCSALFAHRANLQEVICGLHHQLQAVNRCIDELGLDEPQEAKVLPLVPGAGRALVDEVAAAASPPAAPRPAPEEAHACSSCERTFGSELGLRIHRARAHRDQEPEKPEPGEPERGMVVQCASCEFVTGPSHIRDLIRHVVGEHGRSVTNDERKPVHA